LCGIRTILLAAFLVPAALGAQTINRERSRFLSEPHGRSGTCAPYRLVFTARGDTERVEVTIGNVRLVREVATKPGESNEVVLPVYMTPNVRVAVAGDEFSPRLPLRRVEPDYEQPYVAVFAADALYVRALVPDDPGRMVCDYFENREFFDDWRCLDGYDAIILFQPEAQRPPPGAQRAIAEFCSMGGAAIIVGSFRMGEKVQGLPAPAEPEILRFSGVSAQRMAYGPGAIYRIDFEELRRHGHSHVVLREALLDHLWSGQNSAPAGKPAARTPASSAPALMRGNPEPPRPGALFFGLAGSLLLLCAVTPLAARRVRLGAWWGAPLICAGALGIGGMTTMQDQPRPLLDCWAIFRAESAGPERPCSVQLFLLPGEGVESILEIPLTGPVRGMPRPFRSAHGHVGWQVDLPLASGAPSELSEFVDGRIANLNFRDFAARAYKGDGGFDVESARLLEWWLDENAYRGRAAGLGPATFEPADVGVGDEVERRARGSLWIVNRRASR
jgi:hypothetical protein